MTRQQREGLARAALGPDAKVPAFPLSSEGDAAFALWLNKAHKRKRAIMRVAARREDALWNS